MSPSPHVALGSRRYRIDRAWLAPGRTHGLTQIVALAVGADGLLYVLRRARPHIVVFSLEGELLARLDDLELPDGHGIFPAPDGSLWVAARDDHAIVHVSPDGQELARIGRADLPAPYGPFGHPTHAVVAPDGELYVSDGYADAFIHRYSADAVWQSSWGRPGVGPGEFRTPHSLWATDDLVYVLDRDNDRLQVFDRAGSLQAVWTDLLRPMAVWVDARGELFVTEQVPRLSRWSAEGELLGRCRLPVIESHGVFGDRTGRIYVAEVSSDTITRLVPESGSGPES